MTDGQLQIAVFFMAFLPQFVQTGGASVQRQVVTLGLLYVALALITDSGYALLAGTLRRWLGARVLQGPWPHRATGVLYIGLGLGTALTGRRQS